MLIEWLYFYWLIVWFICKRNGWKEDWNVEINKMIENVSCIICYCIKSLFVVVKWVVGGSDVVGNVVWW